MLLSHSIKVASSRLVGAVVFTLVATTMLIACGGGGSSSPSAPTHYTVTVPASGSRAVVSASATSLTDIQRSAFELTLLVIGNGAVTLRPMDLSCLSLCTSAFIQGTVVTLTATPKAESTFLEWSEGCRGGTNVCIVTMSEARSVTAKFSTVRVNYRFVPISMIAPG
jgi:Divergent InlB B-repeat domain